MLNGLLPVLSIAAAIQAVPASPEPAAETDEIVITGYSKPYQLNGKQLANAARAFAKYRSAYAPQSRLLFEVRRKSGRDLSGLRLSLRSRTTDIPLVLDAQSRFVLPAVVDKTWQLVANRGSGSVEVGPLVLSPGTSADDRRLGDMRLECQVAWSAFVTPELPLLLRRAAAAVNVCRRSDFAFFRSVNQPIKSALITAGASVTPVKLGANGASFRYPGYDKRLPNDARVRFVYN